jgi:hypothetical protein
MPMSQHATAIVSRTGSTEGVARVRDVSVVVPAKDEEQSLPLIVARIVEACTASGIALRDIVLVDDGSSDGTWAAMSQLAADNAIVQAIRLRRNFGKATALMVGIGACAGDVVITMDADLQDDPDEIPRFLETLDAGYDLVSGWKKDRHDPLSKTLPSRLFNRVTASISGVRLHDFNCGFKAYRREIFDSVELYGELHRYVPVLAALGYKVAEIPVRHHARRFGKSNTGLPASRALPRPADGGDDHPLRLPAGPSLRRLRPPVLPGRRRGARLSDCAEALHGRQHRQPAIALVRRHGGDHRHAAHPVRHAGGADHQPHPAAGRRAQSGGAAPRPIAPMRRLLPAFLALAVSAVCLWFLLTPQIVASFARVLAQASPLPLLAAFALVALVQWLRAWRFAVMMTGRLALPGAALTRIAFQLNFWNFLLPLRLGELSYPVLMNRHLGYGLLHATGVLLIARLFDLAAVGAILLGAAAALDVRPAPPGAPRSRLARWAWGWRRWASPSPGWRCARTWRACRASATPRCG